jgi:hypothetical protein
MANLGGREHTERKKSEKEETNGEGLPEGKPRCHSKHMRFVSFLKKPPE